MVRNFLLIKTGVARIIFNKHTLLSYTYRDICRSEWVEMRLRLCIQSSPR